MNLSKLINFYCPWGHQKGLRSRSHKYLFRSLDMMIYIQSDFIINPVDTGRKLNVHKTFRKRPVLLLNVLCTFNLRPVSTGQDNATATKLVFGSFVTLQNTLISLMIKSSLDSLLVKVFLKGSIEKCLKELLLL